MRSRIGRLLATTMLFTALPLAAQGASDTETLTINAIVAARATLTIAPTTINFPDADPDATPSIPANENSVSVQSKVRTSSAGVSTLTCLANGALQSVSDAIAISNVTWTASGAGYVPGTMSDVAAQNVGSWSGSGTRNGNFDFSLANSWDYNVGSYTQTVLYTLSAP